MVPKGTSPKGGLENRIKTREYPISDTQDPMMKEIREDTAVGRKNIIILTAYKSIMAPTGTSPKGGL
jgi:hypothetical protein